MKLKKVPFLKKRDAWSQLQHQTAETSFSTQDVHSTQNFESGDMGEVRSKTPFKIMIAVLCIFVALLAYGLLGFISFTVDKAQVSFAAEHSAVEVTTALGVQPYWGEYTPADGSTTCFYQVKPDGSPVDNARCASKPEGVAYPQWHDEILRQAEIDHGVAPDNVVSYYVDPALTYMYGIHHFGLIRFAIAVLLGIVLWSVISVRVMRQVDAQNLMTDTQDINQYKLDGRLALPEEIIRKYGVFPDVGAHSPVMPASLISHAMLTNKGVNKIDFPERYESDVVDETGDIVAYKGEIKRGSDGAVRYRNVPMFDKDFAEALFDASKLPNDKSLRIYVDPSATPYNPDHDRDKYGNQATIAEHINEMWTIPDYEPQRPAGVYIIDEAPVNTMVLAITRAGKGQTYIEPMIDMWSRESRPNNMVINDPKGELLLRNFARFTMRGFQVIQFNLINPLKTDIYNPLGLASEEARAGNFQKCAEYVENIADVFFPLDGAEDPLWPSAANNAFKRTVYGLIDAYLEEEAELRDRAQREKWDPKILDNRIDEIWGRVTLYNAYAFFVQLSSKKLANPEIDFQKKVKSGAYNDTKKSQAQMEKDQAEAQAKAVLWNNEPEIDMLTLFFNATDALPSNGMRNLVSNSDKSLRAMGGAEKMLASVYGIAITSMSFFTDPTISALTSGTPSQNVDLAGLSFPRRIGVRFHHDYVNRYNFVGKQVLWESYTDATFTKSLGKKFMHDDIIGRDGWARYLCEGIYEGDEGFIKLEIVNPSSGTLIKTFYFKFVKRYQTNLSGRKYVKDPIKGTKIVRNGVLIELRKKKSRKTGREVFVPADTQFKTKKLSIVDMSAEEVASSISNVKPVESKTNAIIANSVRWSEQIKAVFLVTPPHLMKYAKLILILIVQLVRLNFSQSYLGKKSQKPLYKTRYMLDELGNLQSEGNGIADFGTMLSIGLGQDQQFTLILQTLQQLRDVYGENSDKIIQGNVSNIIFLKSTDDAMIDTLVKMSGVKHVARRNSKVVSKDVEKVMLRTEGTVSYTISMEEEPVIPYNVFASLPERNSIVFRAGDQPIWNRNSNILPMSWRLFKDTIVDFNNPEYTLQTVPTLSSSLEFDVSRNQPNFFTLLAKRQKQAEKAAIAISTYKEAYGYSDFDIARLSPDVYSMEVMEIVRALITIEDIDTSSGHGEKKSDFTMGATDFFDDDKYEAAGQEMVENSVDNEELEQARYQYERQNADADVKRYANGKISRNFLVTTTYEGDRAVYHANNQIAVDTVLLNAYHECQGSFNEDPQFDVNRKGELFAADSGHTPFIIKRDESEALQQFQKASEDEESSVYGEDIVSENVNMYVVTDAFKEFLASLDTWSGIAGGDFDAAAANAYIDYEEQA